MPLGQILLPPPVREGLKLDKVRDMAWALVLGQELPPIIVRREEVEVPGRGTLYTLTEGRHRYVAHVTIGRPDIAAQEEE